MAPQIGPYRRWRGLCACDAYPVIIHRIPTVTIIVGTEGSRFTRRRTTPGVHHDGKRHEPQHRNPSHTHENPPSTKASDLPINSRWPLDWALRVPTSRSPETNQR